MRLGNFLDPDMFVAAASSCWSLKLIGFELWQYFKKDTLPTREQIVNESLALTLWKYKRLDLYLLMNQL